MLHQEMRPYRFDDMVGQEDIVENIRNQAKKNIWFQVYIFGRQYGGGKTTLARIIALSSNCLDRDGDGNPCLTCEYCRTFFTGSADIKEIDGASHTGIDNIRELKEWLGYRPLGTKKVAIIDEAHKLSNSAFNSLLKLLEEPPSYAIVILCSSEMDSIPKTIQSRSACYEFGQIAEPLIVGHLRKVSEKKGIAIDDEACQLIAKRANGAMRNALVLLEQLSAAGKEITGALCREILGLSHDESIFGLLEALLCQDIPGFATLAGHLGEAGRNFSTVTNELLSAATDLIVAATGNDCGVAGTGPYKEFMRSLVSKYSLPRFCELSGQVMLLRESVRKNESKNWFLVNGIAAMQKSMQRDGRIWEELLRLRQEVDGLKLGLQQGAMPPGAVPTSKEDPVDGPLAFQGSGHPPVTGADADFDGLFDGEEFWDELDSERATDLYKPYGCHETATVCGTVGMEAEETLGKPPVAAAAVPGLDKAATAEAQVMQLAKDYPELAPHIQVGCTKEHTDDGLVLATPERSVCNLLILHIGRAGIPNVTVRCQP